MLHFEKAVQDVFIIKDVGRSVMCTKTKGEFSDRSNHVCSYRHDDCSPAVDIRNLFLLLLCESGLVVTSCFSLEY